MVSFACVLTANAPQAEAAAPAPDAPTPARAWRAAAESLFPEAQRDFETLDGAEAELGDALLLLVRQPKTVANVDLAVSKLLLLVEREPMDEIVCIARYYLGRIEQVHRATPSPDAARGHYRKLIADAPGNFFAECAAIKLALIDLYEVLPAAEHRARFDACRSIAPSLVHSPARRDLALLLADVALQFGYGEDVALEELLQADRLGITRPSEQANVWIRIAELARLTGREEIAGDHYRRFLATFGRDSRRTLVEERLASLSAASRP